MMYDEHLGNSTVSFVQIIRVFSCVFIVIYYRDEESEIDVTSGFYALLGSGKIYFELGTRICS